MQQYYIRDGTSVVKFLNNCLDCNCRMLSKKWQCWTVTIGLCYLDLGSTEQHPIHTDTGSTGEHWWHRLQTTTTNRRKKRLIKYALNKLNFLANKQLHYLKSAWWIATNTPAFFSLCLPSTCSYTVSVSLVFSICLVWPFPCGLLVHQVGSPGFDDQALLQLVYMCVTVVLLCPEKFACLEEEFACSYSFSHTPLDSSVCHLPQVCSVV